MGLDGWKISSHALDRALDMSLTPAEIRELLAKPESRRPSGLSQSGQQFPAGRELWKHGRIAAAVDPEKKNVITFLWWSPDDRFSRDGDETGLPGWEEADDYDW